MTVLVLGATGQVGSHLAELAPYGLFWGREDLDLARPDTVAERIRVAAPSAIVNAAAYTAVDRAEAETHLVWCINAESPAAMARAAAALDVPLIHISTDYVFDGSASRPYTEADGAHPVNVYGRTKLAGELAIESLCSRYWILRTSWVFSEFGSNFVKTVLRLAREREQLRIVNDQWGTPGYAGDLARLIAALLERVLSADGLPPGTYHTGGGREVTWFEFAREIVRRGHALGLVPKMPDMVPIPTSEYPTAARRPGKSTLKPNQTLQSSLGVTPDWEQGLDAMLTRMRDQQHNVIVG